MKFGFLCEDAAKYDLEYEISPLAPFPSRHLNLITENFQAAAAAAVLMLLRSS